MEKSFRRYYIFSCFSHILLAFNIFLGALVHHNELHFLKMWCAVQGPWDVQMLTPQTSMCSKYFFLGLCHGHLYLPHSLSLFTIPWSLLLLTTLFITLKPLPVLRTVTLSVPFSSFLLSPPLPSLPLSLSLSLHPSTTPATRRKEGQRGSDFHNLEVSCYITPQLHGT